MKTWTGKVSIKFLLNGVIVLFALIAPFTHIFYPKTSIKLNNLKLEYDKKIKPEIVKNNRLYINFTNNNTISKNDFIQKKNALNKKIKDYKKEYKSKKAVIIKQNEYLGYSSFRYFLYALGLPIGLFILSLRYWYLILSKVVLERFHRIVLNIEAFSFTFVSLYWLSWVFLTKSDFKIEYYQYSYVFIILLITSILYFGLKHFIYTEKHKLRIIQYLNRQIFVEIKNDFISLLDADKYHKRLNNILDKQVNL